MKRTIPQREFILIDDEASTEEVEVVDGATVSAVKNDLPDFAETGLPGHLAGSWVNAKVILKDDGVKCHPLKQDSHLVISLCSYQCHRVSKDRSNYSCDGFDFKERMCCAPVIAAAHKVGAIVTVIARYLARGLSNMVASHSMSGKKPCSRPLKQAAAERDVEEWVSPEMIDEKEEREESQPVYAKYTTANECFGCSVDLRASMTASPPLPYDVFVRRKVFRSYGEKAAGKNPSKLYITAKSNMLTTINLKCMKLSGADAADMLIIAGDVAQSMWEKHKQHLWSQFGIEA